LETSTAKSAPADIQAVIGNVDHLPTPPVVFSQINRVLSNPNASVYDVAKIIAEDAGMSARVLRMANSAYYGLPQPVSSVRQAVVILGLEAVRSLVLSAAVLDTFSGYDANPEFQDRFWRHSLATGSAARVLYGSQFSDQAIRNREEGFSAGLLHDIGKLIMVCHLPSIQAQAATHPLFRIVDDRFIEDHTAGITHADIGGYLAQRWNLPESLATAITHHHDLVVENPEHEHLTKVVHVADYLAYWAADPAPNHKKVLPLMNWEIAAEFGLSEDTLEEIGGLVRDEFSRSETFLEMAKRR
jgi:HD-like signal output (HDOD) protein